MITAMEARKNCLKTINNAFGYSDFIKEVYEKITEASNNGHAFTTISFNDSYTTDKDFYFYVVQNIESLGFIVNVTSTAEGFILVIDWS